MFEVLGWLIWGLVSGALLVFLINAASEFYDERKQRKHAQSERQQWEISNRAYAAATDYGRHNPECIICRQPLKLAVFVGMVDSAFDPELWCLPCVMKVSRVHLTEHDGEWRWILSR